MACQRCQRDLPTTHVAYSKIINLAVCAFCVLEALDLPVSRDDDSVFVRPIGPEIDPVRNPNIKTRRLA